jgi:hypothetical protein
MIQTNLKIIGNLIKVNLDHRNQLNKNELYIRSDAEI